MASDLEKRVRLGDLHAERPENRGARKPIQTHGKTVIVNQKVASELARPVRVLIDASGLPVPVPVEVWNAMGL